MFRDTSHWIKFCLFILIAVCVNHFTLGCENCSIISRKEFSRSGRYHKVIPKCCNVSETIVQNIDKPGSICEDRNKPMNAFTPFIITNNDTHVYNITVQDMMIVVGDPCQFGKYPLIVDDEPRDMFFIFSNGSLYTPNSSLVVWRNLSSFCLDYYTDENEVDHILPFVCFEESNNNMPDRGKYYVYAIGLIISLPFLISTLLTYVIIPELRDLHGRCLICHVICLIFAFASLASVQIGGDNFPQMLCSSTAFIIQYFFLAAFCWLTVMCFNIWLNVSQHPISKATKGQECRYFLFYSIFSWSFPTIFFIVTLVMDLFPAIPAWYIKPQIGVISCWFKTDEALFPYFYGPIAVLICVNICFFVSTARMLIVNNEKANRPVNIIERPEEFDEIVAYKERWRKHKNLFRHCVLLFLVMGINWTVEVVSWAIGGKWTIWIAFDILNSLQGLMIFVIFVLQRPVRNIIKKKWQECFRNHLEEGEELHNMTSNTIVSNENMNGRTDHC